MLEDNAKYPCCKKKVNVDKIFRAINELHQHEVSSTAYIPCPECGKTLIVYLDIDEIDYADEEEI